MKLAKNKTQIIGILNITPDSFSDGGTYYGNIDKAVSRAYQLISEGADIIDIGGESTRPGSKLIKADEELKRILPVIRTLQKNPRKMQISIDTYKSEVAEKVLSKKVKIINSLGGFTFDENLARTTAASKAKIIIYHIKGLPQTMQKGKITYKDLIDEISNFFLEQINFGLKHGIKIDQFILDPGIGFGKTVAQNLEIIKRLDEFKKFSLPLAIGVSRKSHLGKILQDTLKLKEQPSENERLEAGLAETAIAVIKGANYIRTHDVKETKKFLALLDMLK